MIPIPPPASGPTLAFLERVLLRLGQAWTLGDPSLKEAMVAMTERVFQAAPALIADHPHSSSTLTALEEPLENAIRSGGQSPVILERSRQSLNEILQILGEAPSGAPPIPPLASAQSQFEAIRSLGSLNRLSVTPDTLAAGCDPGFLLLVGDRLSRIVEVADCKESYAGQTWTWIEVEVRDLASGLPQSLSLEKDDQWEGWLTYRRLSGPQVGLDVRAMERFDDRESGSHTFEGGAYRYTDSGEAVRTPRGSGRGSQFFYVEFEGPGGAVLSAESYEGEVEAFLSSQVDLGQVRLFREDRQ
jgi:hypothetical protein